MFLIVVLVLLKFSITYKLFERMFVNIFITRFYRTWKTTKLCQVSLINVFYDTFNTKFMFTISIDKHFLRVFYLTYLFMTNFADVSLFYWLFCCWANTRILSICLIVIKAGRITIIPKLILLHHRTVLLLMLFFYQLSKLILSTINFPQIFLHLKHKNSLVDHIQAYFQLSLKKLYIGIFVQVD